MCTLFLYCTSTSIVQAMKVKIIKCLTAKVWHGLQYIVHTVCIFVLEAESKEKPGVWDPMLEWLYVTSPYVHSRVDYNTFTMGGQPHARVGFIAQSGTLDLASEHVYSSHATLPFLTPLPRHPRGQHSPSGNTCAYAVLVHISVQLFLREPKA
jgi:hypothetical protein